MSTPQRSRSPLEAEAPPFDPARRLARTPDTPRTRPAGDVKAAAPKAAAPKAAAPKTEAKAAPAKA